MLLFQANQDFRYGLDSGLIDLACTLTVFIGQGIASNCYQDSHATIRIAIEYALLSPTLLLCLFQCNNNPEEEYV
jgi:hypothetical protein